MNMVATHTAHLLKTSSHKTIASLFIQKQKRLLHERRRNEAIHNVIAASPMMKQMKRTVALEKRRETRTIAR